MAFFDWLRERTRDSILAGSYEAAGHLDRPGQADEDAQAATDLLGLIGASADPVLAQRRAAQPAKQQQNRRPPAPRQLKVPSNASATLPQESTKSKSQRALEAGLDADLLP